MNCTVLNNVYVLIERMVTKNKWQALHAIAK